MSASVPICVLQALGDFDLADDAFDRVDVGRNANLRDEDRVELGAGLLDDVDDVAIHVVRIETVDTNARRFCPRPSSQDRSAPG